MMIIINPEKKYLILDESLPKKIQFEEMTLTLVDGHFSIRLEKCDLVDLLAVNGKLRLEEARRKLI